MWYVAFDDEPCGGLYQWDGHYIITGQNALPGTHHYQGRVVRLYRSHDFVNWSLTSSIAFVRTLQHQYLGAGRSREGDQTFIYYCAWDPRHWENTPERGGVGIAVLPRDRFGDLVVDESGKGPGDYQLPEITSEFVTAAIAIKGDPRFHMNAGGLGPDAGLKIELLDHKERPLSGYTTTIRADGIQTPIIWSNPAGKLPEQVRVHIIFEGKRSKDIRFSALYITTE